MLYELRKEKKGLSKSIYYVIISCVLFLGLNINGVGVAKLLYSSLMLVSFFYIAKFFLKKFNKANFSGFSKYYIFCFTLIIIYGVITSLRSFSFSSELLTLFGNPYTALAWLTPIVFIFASNFQYLSLINRLSILLIKIGVVVAPLLLLVNQVLGLYGLYFLSCLYFLPFLTWKYQRKKDKKWIIIGIILFLTYSFLGAVRTGFVQVILHILAFYALAIINSYKKGSFGKFKSFLLLLIGGVAFGFVLFNDNDILANLSNDDKVDTRSFLYSEVFEDLTKNNSLTFGKGALGRYYSDFFYQYQESGFTDGDSYDRFTVEVGFLEMLLKGGWVMVILFFMICLPATFQAIFYSKNLMAKGLGFYSLVYLIIVFISNRPLYSNVYICFWIVIGFCSSKTFRNTREENLSIAA